MLRAMSASMPASSPRMFNKAKGGALKRMPTRTRPSRKMRATADSCGPASSIFAGQGTGVGGTRVGTGSSCACAATGNSKSNRASARVNTGDRAHVRQ